MIRKTKFIIASVILITLTACGSSTTQTDTTPTNSPDPTASPSPSLTDTPQTTSSPTSEGIIFKEPAKNQVNGFIDSLNNSTKASQTIESGKPIQLSGWASVPDQSQPAESVLITYGDNNTVATTIPVNQNRPDVAKALKKPALEKSGWMAKLDPATLNLTGTAKIKAWSFNSQTKEAYPLGNSYEIVLK